MLPARSFRNSHEEIFPDREASPRNRQGIVDRVASIGAFRSPECADRSNSVNDSLPISGGGFSIRENLLMAVAKRPRGEHAGTTQSLTNHLPTNARLLPTPMHSSPDIPALMT